MNVNLYIEKKPVELFGDENITLIQRIKDLENLGVLYGDFTQNFSVPATRANNEIFKHYYNISVEDGFNAHYKVDAQLGFGGLHIFEGVVELLSVKMDSREPVNYEIVFYGTVSKFSTIFGEDTLQDIDFTSLDHVWNYQNIIDSWSDNLLGGKVIYPLMDYARGFYYSLGNPNNANNLANPNEGIRDDEFRPSFDVREIVRLVFANYGITVGGEFFTSKGTEDLYVLPMRSEGTIKNNIGTDKTAEVENFTDVFYAGNVGYVKINMPTKVYDPSNLLDTAAQTYTAPDTGVYNAKVEILIAAGTTPNSVVRVRPIVNGVSLSTLVYQQVLGIFGTILYYNFNIILNAGDTFWMEISTDSASGITVNPAVFSIVKTPETSVGGTLSVSSLMPDVTVVDFIKGIFQMFNAIITSADIDLTEIEISFSEQWYSRGQIKNWTKYVDSLNGTYEKIRIPRTVDFSHAEAEDMANTIFKSEQNRAYGSTKYTVDYDFAEGTKKVETPFNILVPSVMPNYDANGQITGYTNLEISKMLDSDSKPVVHPLTLFYKKELNTSYDYYVEDTVNNTHNLQTEFLYYGTYQDRVETNGTYSLAFSLEDTLRTFANAKMPLNTLYKLYYSDYIKRIYDSDNKYFLCEAVLPVGEFLNFRLNDTVEINGYYFKVEEFRYSMNKEKAFLKLFRYKELTTANNPNNNTGFEIFFDPNRRITRTDIRVNNLENISSQLSGFSLSARDRFVFNPSNLKNLISNTFELLIKNKIQ